MQRSLRNPDSKAQHSFKVAAGAAGATHPQLHDLAQFLDPRLIVAGVVNSPAETAEKAKPKRLLCWGRCQCQLCASFVASLDLSMSVHV